MLLSKVVANMKRQRALRQLLVGLTDDKRNKLEWLLLTLDRREQRMAAQATLKASSQRMSPGEPSELCA